MTVAATQIKTYSKRELAALYGINGRTLIAWFMRNDQLKDLAKNPQKLLNPSEVKLVFSILGNPEE